MSTNRPITFRDGTGQDKRMPKALDPDYVSVDERSAEDLLRFVRRYAEKLRYFNEINVPDGDWSFLFKIADNDMKEGDDEVKIIADFMKNPQSFVNDAEKMRWLTRPHVALFLTFLHLLRHPQKQFKELTRRHLDFYYRDVLKLQEKAAVPDRVHVVFELAKNVNTHLVKKGTLLNAGKDSEGVDLNYATDEDIVVNRSQVSSIKTLYARKDDDRIFNIHATSVAEAERNEAVAPTRFRTFTEISHEDPFPIGFAIASPILLMKEGRRTITLILACQEETFARDKLTDISEKGISPFDIFLSSGSEWINFESPKMEVGNFVLGDSIETYDEKTLPIVSSRGYASPLLYTVKKNTFDESSKNQCLVATDGTVYRITDITEYEEHQQVSLTFIGQVRNPDSIKKYGVYANCLKFRLTLDNVDPAILPFEPSGSPHDIDTNYPVLKLVLKNFITEDEKGESVTYYEQFRHIVLEKVNISVEVEGMQDIRLRNDRSLLDPKSPFEPFGSAPTPGSGFYIADTEICGKRLDSLSLRIQWLGLPESLKDHYRLYSMYGPVEGTIVNTSFNAQLKLFINRLWVGIEAPKALFDSELKSTISLSYTGFDIEGYDIDLASTMMDTNDPLEMPRCFKLELGSPDFQHDAYSLVMNKVVSKEAKSIAEIANKKTEQFLKILQSPFITKEIGGILVQAGELVSKILKYLASLPSKITKKSSPMLEEAKKKQEEYSANFTKDTEGGGTEEDKEGEMEPLIVPLPYTPSIKAISLDYASSAEIDLSSAASIERSKARPDKMFQLHPFGYIDIWRSPIERESTLDEANVEESDGTYYLMPQYNHEGYLYIGIADLDPPQNLSILFQLVMGSGNPELKAPVIRWSYLSEDYWKDFEKTDILSDTTNGLLDTGIIRLSVSGQANTCNTLMPAGKHWLRATVRENAEAVPDMLNIKTQAIGATFQDQGNAPDHLKKPLDAYMITGLVERDSAIKSVSQPCSSFQGRMKETGNSFYTRVGERLRHKQRALTTWDYERLVLERFPSIHKVKCLNQIELEQLGEKHASASPRVTIVVVPDITAGTQSLLQEPKVSPYWLKEIETYLKTYTSPFVELNVRSPRYQRVRCRLSVRFREGYDPGYYLRQLNKDIREFISPWAYGKQAEICFGGAIHHSELLQFIETREYVDYLANLKFIEPTGMENGSGISSPLDVSTRAQILPPDVILVSSAEHIIDLIQTPEYRKEDFEGIGYMITGIDFEINRPSLIPDSIGDQTIGEDFVVTSDQ